MRLEGERILPFAVGVAGAEHEQARVGSVAADAAHGAENRHFAAVFEQMVRGLAGVAERGKQPPKPLALLEDALARTPLVCELSAEALVLRGESAEFGVGHTCRGGFRLLAPAFEGGLDVAGEDLGQVVVAVELVLVVDAGSVGMG